MSQEKPVVFINYASPDRDRVQSFSDHLKAAGFRVWMDHEQLKPSQQWDFEIRRALAHADFVLIFISNNSVNRRGYVPDGIRLFFPPYHVGAYATGSHVITIPFRAILAFMRPEFISALSLQGLKYQMEYPQFRDKA